MDETSPLTRAIDVGSARRNSGGNDGSGNVEGRWLPRLGSSASLAALAVTNVLLFLQVQAVTLQVARNRSEIGHLHERAAHEAQTTAAIRKKVEDEHSLVVVYMAGVSVVLACLVTAFHMTAHLRNFHEPAVQRKIVAVLWMSPVYGLASWISLCFPSTQEYTMILKDFYEAYCVYTFLAFLVAVLGRGDRRRVVRLLARHSDQLREPSACTLYCLRDRSSTANCSASQSLHSDDDGVENTRYESALVKSDIVLRECQILAMQFVLLRPLTSIASFLNRMLADSDSASVDMHEDQTAALEQSFPRAFGAWLGHHVQSFAFWNMAVQNVSVFLAFTGLLKFYHAVQTDLQWCQPFSKFLCIKGIVFMTFWQGLVVSIVVSLHRGSNGVGSGSDGGDGNDYDYDYDRYNGRSPKDEAASLQNILVCAEMLFFSLAHWCVFPTEEWAPGYRPKKMEKPGLGFADFAQDVAEVFRSSPGLAAVEDEGKSAERQEKARALN